MRRGIIALVVAITAALATLSATSGQAAVEPTLVSLTSPENGGLEATVHNPADAVGFGYDSGWCSDVARPVGDPNTTPGSDPANLGTYVRWPGNYTGAVNADGSVDVVADADMFQNGVDFAPGHTYRCYFAEVDSARNPPQRSNTLDVTLGRPTPTPTPTPTPIETPTPEPTPTPTPGQGTRIYNADFEALPVGTTAGNKSVGSFSGLGAFGEFFTAVQHDYDSRIICTLTAVASPVRTGGRAMRLFASHPSGVSSRGRCQPTEGARTRGVRARQGDDVWYGVSYFVPVGSLDIARIVDGANWFFDTEGFRNVGTNANGPGAAFLVVPGSMPAGFSMAGAVDYGKVWTAGINLDGQAGLSHFNYGRRNVSPVTDGVWLDYVAHIKWSTGSDGRYDSWGRVCNPDQPESCSSPLVETGAYNGRTLQSTSYTIERRQGVYEGAAWTEDHTLDIDNIRNCTGITGDPTGSTCDPATP